jgi:predicted MPP superfamily phosphohydrolase
MPWLDLARRIPALWQDGRTRTQLLSGAGAVAGIGAMIASYAFLREPLHVRLDRLTIHLPNATGNLPPNGLRLLHLSDTHFRGINWREQAKIDCIRRACAGLEYDLLIHTGDFLHHDSGLPNVLALLDALPAPRLGSYAVFGNHDYSIYSHSGFLPRAWARFQALHQGAECATEALSENTKSENTNGHSSVNGFNATRTTTPARAGNATPISKQNGYRNGRVTPLARVRTLYEFGYYCANVPLDLKRTGRNDTTALEAALAVHQVQTLHNRAVRLTHPEVGLDIYMAGVDDVVEGTPELHRALGEIPYDAPTILLSHNPDILLEPGIEQADLILSGHTHGGQIVLPLLGPAHTQSSHLRRKEVSGYLRRGKTQVYITRGVGEGIPFRLGAAPQITLITILPAAKS